jgi:uncharacterized protein
MSHLPFIACVFFFVAMLYASVGHGGASSYITVMIILGFSLNLIRPTALILNVAVSSLALWSFARHGHLNLKDAISFLLGSVPLVMLTSRLHFHPFILTMILTLALICTALRLLIVPGEGTETHRPKTFSALGWGAGIGVLSGISGIGGGVFLSPVLIFKRWANLRGASAISALFILVNSLVGLIVRQPKLSEFPPQLPIWLVMVILGGLLGGYLGSHKLNLIWLRRALALVTLLACVKLWWI